MNICTLRPAMLGSVVVGVVWALLLGDAGSAAGSPVVVGTSSSTPSPDSAVVVSFLGVPVGMTIWIAVGLLALLSGFIASGRVMHAVSPALVGSDLDAASVPASHDKS